MEETWIQRLIGQYTPNWFRLGRDARARRLKTGRRRGIWVVELGGRTIYAKVSRLPKHSLRERLRIWLHVTPAEREWRVASAARLRGAPVVHFVALGVRGGGRPGTVLISEAISQSRTLSEAWASSRKLAQAPRRGTRLSLIDTVAKMYADAHRAGLVHPDNHPQNIIVSQLPAVAADCPGTHSAALVDLPDARLRTKSARRNDRVRTLAQLEHHFRRIATRTERLRFLRAYLMHYAQRSASPETRSTPPLPSEATAGADTGPRLSQSKLRPWLARIAAARADHAVKLARVRDRRLKGDGKYFGRIHLAPARESDRPLGVLNGDYTATVVLKLERRHVFPEPGVPDREPDDWESLLVRMTRPPAKGNPTGLQVYTYHPRNWHDRLRWTLFGSPAERFFWHCHQLRHRDIPAPLPLAVMAGRKGRLIDCVWLFYHRKSA